MASEPVSRLDAAKRDYTLDLVSRHAGVVSSSLWVHRNNLPHQPIVSILDKEEEEENTIKYQYCSKYDNYNRQVARFSW